MKFLILNFILFWTAANTFQNIDGPDSFQEAKNYDLPFFLKGTWKIEGRDQYEHWDVLNDDHMKGLSYKIQDNNMVVTEYISIQRQEKEIIYTAYVIGQNQGKGIDFGLIEATKSKVCFENLQHDFPNKICYHQVSENELSIRVEGKDGNGFSFRMVKRE